MVDPSTYGSGNIICQAYSVHKQQSNPVPIATNENPYCTIQIWAKRVIIGCYRLILTLLFCNCNEQGHWHVLVKYFIRCCYCWFCHIFIQDTFLLVMSKKYFALTQVRIYLLKSAHSFHFLVVLCLELQFPRKVKFFILLTFVFHFCHVCSPSCLVQVNKWLPPLICM